LKAIAEKLIPGIPEETRVSILQQTDTQDVNTDVPPEDTTSQVKDVAGSRTVLEDVIDKATARNELEQEITGQSSPLLPQKHKDTN
jgi:hypothetical protein